MPTGRFGARSIPAATKAGRDRSIATTSPRSLRQLLPSVGRSFGRASCSLSRLPSDLERCLTGPQTTQPALYFLRRPSLAGVACARSSIDRVCMGMAVPVTGGFSGRSKRDDPLADTATPRAPLLANIMTSALVAFFFLESSLRLLIDVLTSSIDDVRSPGLH
jgi:hypothetical protein